MRTPNGFLGGLAEHDESAAPLLLELRQHARSAQKNRHVNVVTAGVHGADFGAIAALYSHVAGIGEAGILDDGERVRVSAHVDRGTRAVAETADNALGNEPGRVVPSAV